MTKIPKFKSAHEEATWWASAKGREFLKQQSVARTSRRQKGSPLSRAASVQIALRLPAPDLAKARKIAGAKGSATKPY